MKQSLELLGKGISTYSCYVVCFGEDGVEPHQSANTILDLLILVGKSEDDDRCQFSDLHCFFFIIIYFWVSFEQREQFLEQNFPSRSKEELLEIQKMNINYSPRILPLKRTQNYSAIVTTFSAC